MAMTDNTSALDDGSRVRITIKCAWCEECLDAEQSANPERSDDGEIICDECYREEYRDDCNRCMDIVDKTELEARPGEMIAVLREAPGLSGDMEPGYYRVKEWPFFADGIIEGYFHDSNLERVADLDQPALDAAQDSTYAAISLCSGCRQAIAEASNSPRASG